MTRRKADLPLQKVTLNLYHGEMERLQSIYPRHGGSHVVRELVHAHLRRIDERVASVVPAVVATEQHLEEILNEPNFGTL